MTKGNVSKPGQPPGPAREESPPAGPATQARPADGSADTFEGAQLLRILEGDPNVLPEPEPTAAKPGIRRMPEGIEVVERRVGVADGQWVLRVHCQCGRHWFEVEEVHWATCPRCHLLVRVNIATPSPPR